MFISTFFFFDEKKKVHANVTYVFTYFKQVPPQRLLFCGTKEGKISLVRALEVDLHVGRINDGIRFELI